MSTQVSQAEGRTDTMDYGYQVHLDGEPLITLRSRHAAVGLTCVFRRNYDGDTTVSIEPVHHTSTNELPGLKDEPARQAIDPVGAARFDSAPGSGGDLPP